MPEESLSEKRAAAGRKGAAARWGARNATAGGQSPAGNDDLVCGTAAELREMAEALRTKNAQALNRARGVSASRVTAFRARHPKATAEQLRGKVYCDTAVADMPRADAPRLLVLNADADVAEIWIYDFIDSWGGYWGISASEVVELLAEITAPRIDVHINSPGGEVFEGIAIKRALASHPAEIRVCVDALAASIASVIAMAGDPICMDSAAMMMIHEASGFCYGNTADMLSMANLLDKVSEVIAGVYADRAGGTAKDWRTRMLAETWYTAAEAIEAGLADQLLDPPQEQTEEPAARSTSLLSALVATATPTPEPPAALSFLRAVKEATHR